MRKSHRPQNDLLSRLFINGPALAVIVLFIYMAAFPALQWIFVLGVAAIASVALWEYDRLLEKKGIVPAYALGIGSVVLYIFAIYIQARGPYSFGNMFWSVLPVLILGGVALGCFLIFALRRFSPLVNIGTNFFGVIYIGVPLAILVLIAVGKNSFSGIWWLSYVIAVTKSADTGGYFVGRYYGRHKLATAFSPKKTLEGAVGGFFAALIVSLALCFIGKRLNVIDQFSYLSAFVLGLIIAIFGLLGDLAESLLKRDAGVKDSNSIPGVGGILDMIDSLLFTVPIFYIYLKVFI